ncbi:MAG: ABC transporter permease, partial [Clostridia bacterium]|nr:ABC transporter permease [Clostridia bacterium]
MYIIKNAFKCMSRSKGRNLLIGIIVLVISVSACLGLSIRQASLTAKQKTMDSMTVTATISFDRNAAMKDAQTEEEDGTNKTFDRSEFAQMMEKSQSLSLDEYLTYAKADSVKDFYYTLPASLNGSDEIEPVTNEEEEEQTTESVQPMPQMPQGEEGGKKQSFGGRNPQKMGAQNDFSVVGYSGESAMTDFINGTSTITSGSVFGEATTDYNCLISSELATFNELAVGDTVVVANPSNEDETYTLTVVGLYEDTTANEESFSIMGSTSTDPANKIYMSYAALKKIMDASSEDSTTVTDSDTGREYNTALQGSLAGTYVFANTDDYYAFEQQVRTLGLDETYTVYSTDIQNFESSLVPLNTLSTMA